MFGEVDEIFAYTYRHSTQPVATMKGEIISCAHKDIYFLETNTKSESTDLANLFASPAGREMVKYKPRTKLKHKLNPALEFFIHNKTKKTVPQDNNNKANQQETSIKCGKATQTETQSKSSRRSSIDLYEEAASILGLTCAQTDNCKCIECQCHYFDFEEEIDFSTGGEYMVDHTSTCAIQ